MIFLRSVVLIFTIWMVTAFINAVISGSCLAVFYDDYKDWPLLFVAVLFMTLLCSVPGMCVLWVIVVVKNKNTLLFRLMLKSGITISAASSILIFLLSLDVTSGQSSFLVLSTVIAFVTSIMIHHTRVISFQQKQEDHE